MSDKQPMQADGQGTKRRDEEPDVASRRGGAGESGGGSYPNPHSEKDGAKDGPENFGGHGGQSHIAYSGPDNPNATTKEG